MPIVSSPPTSIRKSGDLKIFGDVQLAAGTNISLSQSAKTITADLSGTIGTENFAGTAGTVSNTTPSAFSSWASKSGAARKVLVYDSGSGKPAWDYLQAYEVLTPMDVTSFTSNLSTTRDVSASGTLDSAPTFTIAYQGDPTSAAIDIDAGDDLGTYPFNIPSPYTAGTGGQFARGTSVSSTRVFTVTGQPGDKTKTLTYTYTNRRWAGPGTQTASLTSAQIIALDDTGNGASDLTNSFSGNLSVVVTGTNNYAWVA